MSDFNFFEHAVVEKAEGKQKTSKLLCRLGLLAVCAVLFIIPLIIFAALAIISFILDAAIIFFFWKYFDRENVYTIEGSTITFSRTRGGFFGDKAGKKKVFDVMIKDFREIAPRTAEADAQLQADGYTKVYMFAPHSTSADQYYATFEQNGQKCVVYFQAVEKSLKLLKYYNSNTIVTVVSH